MTAVLGGSSGFGMPWRWLPWRWLWMASSSEGVADAPGRAPEALDPPDGSDDTAAQPAIPAPRMPVDPPAPHVPPPYPGWSPPPGRSRKRPSRLAALGVAVVLLIVAVGAGWYLHQRAERTVTLLAVEVPGPEPFWPQVPGTVVVPTVRFAATADRTPIGNEDGLYFDTQGGAGCDRARLDALLRDDPMLARAWVAPFGIAPTATGEFVAALTPVRLRADTRVTAHHWSGGRAEPYPAVLQAGTAVFVDAYGVPRMRCADAAPLTAAQPVEDPVYGGGWTGFESVALLEIRAASTPVREFGLVDSAGEQPFRRPAGTLGPADLAALPRTGRLDGPYVLTGAQTRCDGLMNCPALALLTLAPRFAGCPESCVVTEVNLGDDVVLTRAGDLWRATGQVPRSRAYGCGGGLVPNTFTVTFVPTASRVVDGVWTAIRVKAEHEVQAQGAGCGELRLAWSINGVGP